MYKTDYTYPFHYTPEKKKSMMGLVYTIKHMLKFVLKLLDIRGRLPVILL